MKPGPKALPIDKRFWSKVRKTQSCWLWTGSGNQRGYGQVFWKRGDESHSYMRLSHIVAYELVVGTVPDGKELDHLCHNRRCVRPDHLEPVTHRENLLRGNTFASAKSRQTHCIHGHAFDAENTRIESNGTRRCRACKIARRAA
jgi:hypothetical protein